jgi:hypothetical protein
MLAWCIETITPDHRDRAVLSGRHRRAAEDGTLGGAALIGSIVLGAVLDGEPVVLLLIKDRPYFRQDR